MECVNVHIGDMGRESVRRRRSRAFRLMTSCGVIAVLAVALLALSVAQRAEIVAASARRDKAQSRLAAIVNEYDRVSLELAKLTSLDRVEEAARANLNMTEPVAMAVVVVDARSKEASQLPETSAGAGEVQQAPTVLAGISGIVQQMVAAAVSNLLATWFVSPPAKLPSVLR